MTLKLFRAMWFLSVLIVLANLLYVYASLPENVIVQEDGNAVNREWLFYGSMISVVFVNLLVYFFKWMFEEGENLRAWFHGLIITINIFFVIAMQAVNVYNSSEMFDHSIIGIYVTGSLILILVWAAMWPIYLLAQRFFLKQAI